MFFILLVFAFFIVYILFDELFLDTPAPSKKLGQRFKRYTFFPVESPSITLYPTLCGRPVIMICHISFKYLGNGYSLQYSV